MERVIVWLVNSMLNRTFGAACGMTIALMTSMLWLASCCSHQVKTQVPSAPACSWVPAGHGYAVTPNEEVDLVATASGFPKDSDLEYNWFPVPGPGTIKGKGKQ